MLWPQVPASRRKATVLRCALAAALFIVFFLFHTTTASSSAARIIGWTPQPAQGTVTSTGTGTIPTSSSTAVGGGLDGNGDGEKSKSEMQETESTETETQTKSQDNQKPVEDGKARPSRLGDAVMELLERYRPSETVPDWTERFDAQLWHWGQPEPDPANITDRLSLDETELAAMREAHQGFVAAVNTEMPEYVPHRYGNSSSWPGEAVVQANGSATATRGIVVVGGGRFNVILAVSLRFLRRAGTTLPVEVFVTEGEYEKDVCETLLPTLNAACRVYPKMHQRVSKGFQLKTFALLFSSFDEILFLDADNTAMRDVAPLFAAPPFRETGLVTWPDFWQATVSPLYYAVAGTPPVPVSARPSTESGQLMIDKARHWKTLLLMTYYNFYGADFYYRLLNQGYTGMGDKETVLPAAAVFGLPAYQVHMPIEKVGHRFEDGSVGGRVMVQYDAVEDWALTKELADGDKTPASEQDWKALYHERAKPVFLHTNWPKWDPTDMLGHVSKWSDMTLGVTGEPEAAFGYPPDLAVEIWGTERMLWEEALWLACHMRTRFRHWRNNGKAVHTCENLQRHFERVFDTDVGRALGLGPDDVLFPKLPDEAVTEPGV